MKFIIIFLIDAYKKLISPWFPDSCRFYPTCSDYAKKALNRFGFFYGIFLSLKRILKCHPFSKGGHDPVPERDVQVFNSLQKKNIREVIK